MTRSSRREDDGSLHGPTAVLYQFTPEYPEEETLLRRAERERARREDTGAIGLTRIPTS